MVREMGWDIRLKMWIGNGGIGGGGECIDKGRGGRGKNGGEANCSVSCHCS